MRKPQAASGVNLPPSATLRAFSTRLRSIEHRPQLSPTERKVYNSLAAAMNLSIDAAVSGKYSKIAHQNILESLLRMRMFCNNGLESRTKNGRKLAHPDQLISLFQQSGDAICAQCSSDILSPDVDDNSETPILTHCCRLICSDCAPQFHSQPGQEGITINISRIRTCPLCNCPDDSENILLQPFGNNEASVSGYSSPDRSVKEYPTKLMTLLADIKEHCSQDKRYIVRYTAIVSR